MVDQTPLLLFAKAPIPGKVKTRLTTHCTPVQAAKIAEILIDVTLHVATTHWPGKVILSVWQHEGHSFINTMLEKYAVTLLPQAAGDLGQKMQAGLDEVAYPAAIMGCDAPLISVDSLMQTHQYLMRSQNVIGPSEDGGYYLIGLSQPALALFNGIDWGQESVFAKTMQLAQDAQIQFFKLAESYDIDRWQDVLRASEQIPALREYLHAEGLRLIKPE